MLRHGNDSMRELLEESSGDAVSSSGDAVCRVRGETRLLSKNATTAPCKRRHALYRAPFINHLGRRRVWKIWFISWIWCGIHSTNLSSPPSVGTRSSSSHNFVLLSLVRAVNLSLNRHHYYLAAFASVLWCSAFLYELLPSDRSAAHSAARRRSAPHVHLHSSRDCDRGRLRLQL
jgi:hypothetical protein